MYIVAQERLIKAAQEGGRNSKIVAATEKVDELRPKIQPIMARMLLR